jgi:hypothetical protein
MKNEFSNSKKYNITHTSTKLQQITGFLRFIKDKNIGVDLYEGDKDNFGAWKKLTLKLIRMALFLIMKNLVTKKKYYE